MSTPPKNGDSELGSESPALFQPPLPTAPQTFTLRRRPTESLPPGANVRQASLSTSTTLRITGEVKKNPAEQIKEKGKFDGRATLDPEKVAALQAALASSSELHPVGASTKDTKGRTTIGRFLFGELGAQPDSQNVDQASREMTEIAKALIASPLFAEVTERALLRAVLNDDLLLLTCKRDALIENPREAECVFLVTEGQIALAHFDPGWLRRERRAQQSHTPDKKQGDKEEYRRRLAEGPLILKAQRNVASFVAGDLVDIADIFPAQSPPTLYAVTPAKVLCIKRALFSEWSKNFSLFAERRRRATATTHERILHINDEHGVVADFFVRHGKSIATTMRVRDLEKCIECYACEKACEDRYGAQRLFLNGKILGNLDFVNTCQTCTDQRCVEVCGYDAISFNAEKGEVLINEDNCTGCTMCARACPYDAITMYGLDEMPSLKARVETDRAKRQQNEGKPAAKPNPLPRKLASKCDHCISYADQACITACPTDALIEIPPLEAFTPRTPAQSEALRDGYVVSAHAKRGELFPITPFVGGMLKPGAVQKGKQLHIEKRSLMPWLWAVSILIFLVCAAEIVLRMLRPTWSAEYLYLVRVMHMPPGMAVLDVVYRPTTQLGIGLGRLGSVLMFATLLYSVFMRTRLWQKLPLVRNVSAQSAFSFHAWAGVCGAAFLALHSGLRLGPELPTLDSLTALPPIIAFWLLLLVIGSGLIGRHLAPRAPAMASQAQLLFRALQDDLSQLRNQHAGVLAADLFFEQRTRRYTHLVPEASGEERRRSALFWLVHSLLEMAKYPLRAVRLYLSLDGIKDRKARRQVTALVLQLIALNRQEHLAPVLAPLVRWWRVAHIPLAVILSLLALGHIAFEEFGRSLLEGGG